MALADLNLDFTNLGDTFKDLAKLAAKVSGTPISMVNLVDNYTVWTISSYGFETQQTPREQSVCQYTIAEKDFYEVTDFSSSPIFQDEEFVTGELNFRFYYGLPLASKEHNLGSLCVIDKQAKSLSAEKVELLKIIASEIVNRLNIISYTESLRNKVVEVKQTQNKVVHDIRGPISGIMNLAELIKEQGQENKLEDVLEFISLIYKGGKSVLDLADEILSEEKRSKVRPHEMLLGTFREKLVQLYMPQAMGKNIELKVIVTDTNAGLAVPQNKLMQIAGNMVSNAIKFTPRSGAVTVTIDLSLLESDTMLTISVTDTGEGLDQQQIERLLADNTESVDGTDGEKGYGFGLSLVKHLVKGLDGRLRITSEVGKGSQFEVAIPFNG